MASSAARNLAGMLATGVGMITKKTRQLAQIFGICVRMELAVDAVARYK
jgi:hypothetical protein